MTPFLIRNDADYDRALELVQSLWNAAPGTADAALLELMAERIQAFEAVELAEVLPPADPRKLIAYKLRELGMSQRALGKKLGWSSGRVSEVLSGRRALTLAMVRDLASALALPAGLLVHDVHAPEDGAVWVRVAAELSASAEAAHYLGEASMEVLVAQLLGRALSSGSAPDLLPVTSAFCALTSATGVRSSRRPDLTLVWGGEALAA